jgi:hypothetical protein
MCSKCVYIISKSFEKNLKRAEKVSSICGFWLLNLALKCDFLDSALLGLKTQDFGQQSMSGIITK